MLKVNLYFRYQGIETLIRTIDIPIAYRLVVDTRGIVNESLLLAKLPSGFLPFMSDKIMLSVKGKRKTGLSRFKNWRNGTDYYFIELMERR